MSKLRRTSVTHIFFVTVSLSHCALVNVNAQTALSASFELLPAEAGGAGNEAMNASGSIVLQSTTGKVSSGTVSNTTASGYQLKPGYIGQLFDVSSLPFSADPDPVLEGSSTQLVPGTAVLDDDTTLALEPSEITWSVLSGAIAAIDNAGVATAGPVAADTPASLQGTLLNFTGQFTVTVKAETAELTLSQNIAEGGTVTGSGLHAVGSEVPITAMSANGYRFAGWTGDGVADPNAADTTVTLTENLDIGANFIKIWELTIAADPDTGGDVGEGGIFDNGTAVAIAATAADGYRFAEWIGEGVADASAESTTVSMASDREIVASFVKVWNLELSANPANGGSVSAGGVFDDGMDVSITATPAVGFRFAGWLGDGVTNPNGLSTMVGMTMDREVQASFIQQWTLAARAEPPNGGTVIGEGVFDHGSQAELTAAPAEGFEFVNWSGDGIANPNKAETTVAMTAARSPVARFRLIENQLPAEFRILTIQRESDGRVFLQWSSEPELTYRVESSTRLDAATWTTLLSIPATGDTTSAATEPIFSQAAFFRVRLGIE